MFTELRTKLSPPRGRAGAVRAGFGERRDVDGEQGWTRARGCRGLGAGGTERDGGGIWQTPSNGLERSGARVLAERGPWCLCPELGGVASGLGDQRTLGLEEVTGWGSCP